MLFMPKGLIWHLELTVNNLSVKLLYITVKDFFTLVPVCE